MAYPHTLDSSSGEAESSPNIIAPDANAGTKRWKLSAWWARLYNGLALTSQAVGFTVAGGTTIKTLTVSDNANVSGTNTGDQTGGTPALTLGTANTAGASTNFIRRDDTIMAFDATVPSTQALGDSAATGSATVAARRDHKHAMPAFSSIVAASISDGDTTHAPDGNSVFDALALKASLASPVFTGNVTGLGVATGTSFNAITGLASSSPADLGTAAVGTSTLAARQDHVHQVQTTITGNAATATKLTTARTIGGVSFDGSAAINLPGVNTAGNQNTSGSSASCTGNAASATYASAVTLTADNLTAATNYPLFASAATGNLSPRTDTGFTYNPSTGVLTSTTFAGALSGNATTSSSCTGNAATATTAAACTGNAATATTAAACTGNAATATKLTTARTINGVSFDGTSDITLAAPGSVDTSLSIQSNASTGKMQIVGPTAGNTRVVTIPDVDATMLYNGGALGTPSSGTLTNCTFPTLNQNTSGSSASCTGNAATANAMSTTTYSSPMGNRNVTMSTSDPSGGSSGDVWLQYA